MGGGIYVRLAYGLLEQTWEREGVGAILFVLVSLESKGGGRFGWYYEMLGFGRGGNRMMM